MRRIEARIEPLDGAKFRILQRVGAEAWCAAIKASVAERKAVRRSDMIVQFAGE